MENDTASEFKQPEIDHDYVPKMPGQKEPIIEIKSINEPFVLCVKCAYPPHEIQPYKGKCSVCKNPYDPALIYQPPFCVCFHTQRGHVAGKFGCQVKVGKDKCKCTCFNEFKTSKKMCMECKGAGHKGDAKNCVGCGGHGWLGE